MTPSLISGAQRHSTARLQQWEQLKYGMFIHFGMSTYLGEELPDGLAPLEVYRPDKLDVDQWISIARDAGMKYAVLTTKHVAGHCLWPSRHTDYHVGNSPVATDVVEAFVNACRSKGVLPGFYYCSWDNHHRFGSITPSDSRILPQEKRKTCEPYTTRAYLDFQTAQLEELLTGYGDIAEVWVDIPMVLPRFYRNELYAQIASWQPDSIIMMNHGIGDGSELKVDKVWPTDIIAIERFLPNSHNGHEPWRTVEGEQFYLPGEVCDPIGREWFFTDEDQPRSDAELLGMYLTTVSRGANLLLDVGPAPSGLITDKFIQPLQRLRENLDLLKM